MITREEMHTYGEKEREGECGDGGRDEKLLLQKIQTETEQLTLSRIRERAKAFTAQEKCGQCQARSLTNKTQSSILFI